MEAKEAEAARVCIRILNRKVIFTYLAISSSKFFTSLNTLSKICMGPIYNSSRTRIPPQNFHR